VKQVRACGCSFFANSSTAYGAVKNDRPSALITKLRKKLEADYDRESKKVEFRIPDYVDKPESAAADTPIARKKAGKGKKQK
jgi:hypothetical protein